jgi:hypothetical protein
LKDADSKDQNHFAGAPPVFPEIKEKNSKHPYNLSKFFGQISRLFPEKKIKKWIELVRIRF